MKGNILPPNLRIYVEQVYAVFYFLLKFLVFSKYLRVYEVRYFKDFEKVLKNVYNIVFI